MSTGVSANLWSQLDARAWSGLTVGTFDGGNITIPTFASSGTGPAAGVYSCAESFASGFGSPAWSVTTSERRTLSDDLNTASGGDLEDIVFDVDPSTGRLRISSATHQIQVTACSNPGAFGLRAADFPTALASEYVAPLDFTRGLLDNETITIGSNVDAATYTLPTYAYEARLLHLMRPASSSLTSPIDRDDDAGATGTLSYALSIALGDSLCRVRCHLDDEDRLVVTWPTALSATAPVWTDTAFAARMGISGVDTLDEFTASGGLSRFRGHRAVDGCYASPLGLAAPFHPTPDHDGSGRFLPGGGAGGYSASARVTYDLQVFLDSTRSAWHQTREVDLEDHFARRFAPYVRGVRPVRVVLNHDWREFLNPNERTAAQPGASLLYATDRYTSARLMQRAPGDGDPRVNFARNGVHQRATLRLTPAAQ